MAKIALVIDGIDNVATALSDINKSDIVKIKGQNKEFTVVSNADIPRGHKIAIADIRRGEAVVKYGEKIGVVISDIKKGDYVHIHNMDSIRGKAEGENNE